MRTLGVSAENYILTYKEFIPKMLIEQFNRAIRLHMESGLESFHSSYSNFVKAIRLRIENGDSGKQPNALRLDQLYFFLTVFGLQIMISIGAFIIEIVVSRCRSRKRR